MRIYMNKNVIGLGFNFRHWPDDKGFRCVSLDITIIIVHINIQLLGDSPC